MARVEVPIGARLLKVLAVVVGTRKSPTHTLLGFPTIPIWKLWLLSTDLTVKGEKQGQAVVAHTFSPSTREAEADESL